MNWLSFILAWFAISIFMLGSYAIVAWLRRSNNQDIDNLTEKNLKAWLQSESFDSLANYGSVCIVCGEYIPPDEQLYCMDCFQELLVKAYAGDLDALQRLLYKGEKDNG